MTPPVTAFVGVGANLGFARDAVLNALADLSHLPDSEFIAASNLYSSAPIDSSGPDYINAVAELRTTQSPRDLLDTLWAIERRYGRVRTERNAPRTLDLDLLVYGELSLQTPELIVPHPRLTERAFVLVPLSELAPDLAIPGHGTVRELIKRVSDQPIVRIDA